MRGGKEAPVIAIKKRMFVGGYKHGEVFEAARNGPLR